MNNHLIYINDDYFQIKTKIINKVNSSSIINGQIIDKEMFIQDFKKVIKDKRIVIKNITILLNKLISEQDILYYTNIFDELNYSKIIIKSTKEYLEDNTLIINKEIDIIYYHNEYYYIYPYLLDSFIQNKGIKKLKILSENKNNITKKCKCFYYSNWDNYFIK